jgi:hypothetical protein
VRHAQSAPTELRPAWTKVVFALLLSVLVVLALALLTAGLARVGGTG